MLITQHLLEIIPGKECDHGAGWQIAMRDRRHADDDGCMLKKGRSMVIDWRMEDRLCADGMDGTCHVDTEDRCRRSRRTIRGFESKPSRGLKKGSDWSRYRYDGNEEDERGSFDNERRFGLSQWSSPRRRRFEPRWVRIKESKNETSEGFGSVPDRQKEANDLNERRGPLSVSRALNEQEEFRLGADGKRRMIRL